MTYFLEALIVIILLFVMGAFVLKVHDNSNSEKIVLDKNSWECTKSHLTPTYIGKVMILNKTCDSMERK